VALASVGETRAALGIDEADAHLTFRLPDEAALDTAVSAAIARASAWLLSRANSSYYTGSSPGPDSTDVDELFKGAEEYAAGHFLFPRLKVRRVFGTHFPYVGETSERYQELIDQELLQLAEELVEPYLNTPITEAEANYSAGVFLVSTPIDRTTDVDCPTTRNQAILDEVTCGGDWWTR
jgi:hypothetical protein